MITIEILEIQEWLAIWKDDGLKIDPETAEVDWIYAQTLDPYGVYPDLPEQYRQVGREYFACAPGLEIWVWFGDIPAKARDRLWERHKSKLAFPAAICFGNNGDQNANRNENATSGA